MTMPDMGSFNPMAAEFVPGHIWGEPAISDTKPDEGPPLHWGEPKPDSSSDDAPPGLGGLFGSSAWRSAWSLPSDTPAKVSHLSSLFLAKADEDSKTAPGLEWADWSTSSYFSSSDLPAVNAPPGLGGREEDVLDDSVHSTPLMQAQTADWDEELEAAPLRISATSSGFAPGDSRCRWHRSANTVGVVSEDGHVFTKTASGRKKLCVGSRGRPVELAALCMVFDESLRCGGMHHFHYRILDGEVGAADGAGFVFDSKVRRNNIQRMRSVFLNQRGCVCIRDHERVKKLGVRLPPLGAGMSLALNIDLDSLYLQFLVYAADGSTIGMAEVSVGGFFGADANTQPGPLSCSAQARKAADMQPPSSGFFCAVVTKEVSVGLA